MTRLRLALGGLALGALAGCVDPNWRAPEQTPAAKAVRSARPAVPVTAQEVHAGNAREIAEALEEELDREQHGELKRDGETPAMPSRAPRKFHP